MLVYYAGFESATVRCFFNSCLHQRNSRRIIQKPTLDFDLIFPSLHMLHYKSFTLFARKPITLPSLPKIQSTAQITCGRGLCCKSEVTQVTSRSDLQVVARELHDVYQAARPDPECARLQNSFGGASCDREGVRPDPHGFQG